jgi:outer membrane protein OmpA-like peptidoglycan-associated protein
MAQVNSLQPGINRQSVDAIVLLWNQLILAAGGRVGSVAAGSVTDGVPSSGAIPVSPVVWLADACVSITVSADRGFSFNGNSSEFVEPKMAEAGAKEVAAEINSSACSGSVTVTGFTASGVNFSSYNKEKEQANQILSRERAQAFADLLKQAGVSVEIKVIGAGKGPIYDWDDAGNLVEKLAEKNRKVVVTQN